MPLDIAILDENERPLAIRSVGSSEHATLIAIAKGAGATRLARWHDYYADAEIPVDELPGFRDELRSLLEQPSLPRELIDLIEFLESMSVRAIRERRKIVAIAD
jgi:hypothetical protein